MYKKITHHIVEEHFDHPMASQIKKSINRPVNNINRAKITNDDILSESKFRTDVNAYLQFLQTKLTDMVNSATGTEEELVIPFEELFKNCKIDELGNLTKPLYPSDFGERINEAMRALIVTIFLVVQTLRVGRDVTPVIGRFNFIRNNLAGNLSNYNSQWGYQTINTLFGLIGTELVKQVNARLKKDLGAEAQAAQQISQAFSTFETAFVEQVINQRPERFTQTVPATVSNSRDIM